MPCVMQDDESPKFTILAQLVPCVSHEFDTCLKSVKVLLNNDRNNVSIVIFRILSAARYTVRYKTSDQ